MTLSGRVVGAAIGLLVGLLFVIAGWRIALILLGGFLVGLLFERRGRFARTARDWFNRLPRS
ncbi:hypothetical protein ACFLSF_04660 [Candidatus Bipolaricaulota bacterium]